MNVTTDTKTRFNSL